MPLRAVRRKGTVNFFADGSVAGRRIRQSLGTGDKRQADEACALLEARLWQRDRLGLAVEHTFEEAALSYLQAGGERRFLAPLIHHFKGRALAAIHPGDIRAAAQALYPGAAAATWNRQAIAPARAVVNHAASRGWCHAIRVENFETRKPLRKIVDRAWIDKFLCCCDDPARPFPHAAAAMLFMFETATRIGATTRILPADVDLARRVVLIASDKEEDWAARAISRELMLRIANLPPRPKRRGVKSAAPLFHYASRHTLAQAIRGVCARAGIPYVPPHQAGRHSAATRALNAGFSVRQVMDAYGWKTARLLLETYAHSENAGRLIADHFETAPPKRKRSKAR